MVELIMELDRLFRMGQPAYRQWAAQQMKLRGGRK
jgi:hypothetical protein